MMADPEISLNLIEPLKKQVVADIADNAIVVRLKFTGQNLPLEHRPLRVRPQSFRLTTSRK